MTYVLLSSIHQFVADAKNLTGDVYVRRMIQHVDVTCPVLDPRSHTIKPVLLTCEGDHTAQTSLQICHINLKNFTAPTSHFTINDRLRDLVVIRQRSNRTGNKQLARLEGA